MHVFFLSDKVGLSPISDIFGFNAKNNISNTFIGREQGLSANDGGGGIFKNILTC
jgi:hypothetical protein